MQKSCQCQNLAKGWWEEMCSNPCSNMKIALLDEAFALLAAKICGISGTQMTMLLSAIMTKENTPAMGPTGNMVAGQTRPVIVQ